MKVLDLMTQEVHTLPPEASLRDAWQLMRAQHIRQIPIVENGLLVGIVTDRDVKRALPSLFSKAKENEVDTVLDMTTVGRVMTREPFTVTSSDPIRKPLDLMIDRKIGGVPVVDEGKLVGIVSDMDFLKLVREQLTDSD